jgi:hypothetical protein
MILDANAFLDLKSPPSQAKGKNVYHDTNSYPDVDTKGTIAHVWQAPHWASWMFEIDSYTNGGLQVNFGKGGFQDGRGGPNGGEWCGLFFL